MNIGCYLCQKENEDVYFDAILRKLAEKNNTAVAIVMYNYARHILSARSCLSHTERGENRQTERVRGRQTDRQIGRQTGRQTDRQTETDRLSETDRQIDTQTDRQSETDMGGWKRLRVMWRELGMGKDGV